MFSRWLSLQDTRWSGAAARCSPLHLDKSLLALELTGGGVAEGGARGAAGGQEGGERGVGQLGEGVAGQGAGEVQTLQHRILGYIQPRHGCFRWPVRRWWGSGGAGPCAPSLSVCPWLAGSVTHQSIRSQYLHRLHQSEASINRGSTNERQVFTWNQILICVSLSCSRSASSHRLGREMYSVPLYSTCTQIQVRY